MKVIYISFQIFHPWDRCQLHHSVWLIILTFFRIPAFFTIFFSFTVFNMQRSVEFNSYSLIETSQYWFVVRNVFKEGLLVIRASRIRARHNFVAHEQPSSHFPIFSNPWIVHLITWKCSLQVWQDTKQFNQENTAPLPWYLIRHRQPRWRRLSQ